MVVQVEEVQVGEGLQGELGMTVGTGDGGRGGKCVVPCNASLNPY